MRLIVTSVFLLGLAACGDGETGQRQAASNTPQIAVRSAEQEQLHQLDDGTRDIGLKRAILESGMPCGRVIRSGYVQEHQALSMWAAECTGNRNWAIFVGPDGSAQVRPCQDLKGLGLPECKIAADPSGRTARGLPPLQQQTTAAPVSNTQ